MRSHRSPFVVTQTRRSTVWREYEGFDIDYRVLKELGEGGFGRVLLVENRKRGTRFAMKQLSRLDEDTNREIELLIKLKNSHPHVVSYFDRFLLSDQKGGVHYCIMMQYMRGPDLFTYVQEERPLSNHIMYHFLKSSLESLEHLHSCKIAHRDIKPANFIVAPYRRPGGSMVQRLVMIDFGLGVHLKPGGVMRNADAEVVVGTPNYSSPQTIQADRRGELWSNAPLDDVWALGCTFYYVCTGEEIATDKGSWESAWREVMRFRPPATIWKHSPVLNDVIHAMLTRNHLKRPNAAELLEMLSEYEAGDHDRKMVARQEEEEEEEEQLQDDEEDSGEADDDYDDEEEYLEDEEYEDEESCSSSEAEAECEECGAVFASEFGLKIHAADKHPKTTKRRRRRPQRTGVVSRTSSKSRVLPPSPPKIKRRRATNERRKPLRIRNK